MLETWVLVEVYESVGDSKPPIGRWRRSQDTCRLSVPAFPRPQISPRGEDLERRLVKGEYLFMAFWGFQCGCLHLPPPTG